MTHLTYNRAASEREMRAIRNDQVHAAALAKVEREFSETAQWAFFVFAFFAVTCAAVFALSAWVSL